MIGSFMLSSESMWCDLAKGICNWYVCPFLVDNFERQIWERSDYESLYPWTNVNHMLLVDTHKWLLVSFQCEFLSIQEVVERFHFPHGSKCLSLQFLIILFSFGQSSGSITNHFPLLIIHVLSPFLEASICRVVSALTSKYGRALMLETSIFSLLKFS